MFMRRLFIMGGQSSWLIAGVLIRARNRQLTTLRVDKSRILIRIGMWIRWIWGLGGRSVARIRYKRACFIALWWEIAWEVGRLGIGLAIILSSRIIIGG